MISDFPIINMKILVPGCGTGQIFDYLNLKQLSDSNLTFTDINKEYLEKLNPKLKKIQKISYKIIVDDIETTKIQEEFDSCILILILEHTEWEKVIKNILNFRVNSFYIIIQKQNKNKQIVISYKDVPKSITKFSTTAKYHLINVSEIKLYFKKEEFNLLKEYGEKVIDNKEMIGLFFSKQ